MTRFNRLSLASLASLASLVAGSLACGAPSTSTASADPAVTAPGDDDAIAQALFAFTIAADRAQFEEHDIAYRDTVGPYAVYEITGDAPALLGPAVRFADDDNRSFAVMCGAADYFTELGDSERVSVALTGGTDGTEVLAASELGDQPYGACTTARDDQGEQVAPPEDGDIETNGSDGGGELGPPELGPVTDRIALSISPAPPVGSRVLLRMAGRVSENPGHNDSHVIPQICCDGGSCALE